MRGCLITLAAAHSPPDPTCSLADAIPETLWGSNTAWDHLPAALLATFYAGNPSSLAVPLAPAAPHTTVPRSTCIDYILQGKLYNDLSRKRAVRWIRGRLRSRHISRR